MTKKLKDLLTTIMTTSEDEADCNTCFEELDRFTEMYAAGDDPAKILPHVEAHLKHCGDCREEFEALLSVLRADLSDEAGR